VFYSTAVSLTKQLDTQGGDLTDTAGHMLATKSKGNSAQFIPSEDYPADLRRLNGAGNGVGWIRAGKVSTTRAGARSIWKDHEIGTLVSVAYVYDTTNYVSSVQPGTQKLDVPDDVDGTCDVYEGIQVQVKANVSYIYESIN